MVPTPASPRLSPADLALFRELWPTFRSDQVAELLPYDLRPYRFIPWGELGEVLQRRLAIAYFAHTSPNWAPRR